MANVAALKKKAAEFEAKKQLEKAIATYREVLDAYDSGSEADAEIALYNRVGDLLTRQGNVAEAVTLYERAVDLYTEGGFFNNAIALCNKVLRTSPGRASIYYKLGKISAAKGFKGEAKQNFLEYADRMQKAGSMDEAFRALKEFADLVPDQDDVRLMLADIQALEQALPKAQRTAKSGDKEAKLRVSAIEMCQAHLGQEKPLRGLQLPDAEAKAIQSFGLLTAKPVMFVANVDENDLAGRGPLVEKVRAFAQKISAGLVCVCAKLESEIAELDEPDRSEMLRSVGLQEPALAVLAREAYRTLGLQSYFTAGEKEVRAWTIPVGATAPQAAGAIHSDFERGFIRAEIYSLEDLEQYHSEKDLRAAGKLRVEGKNYIMQDGDICHFLFKV